MAPNGNVELTFKDTRENKAAAIQELLTRGMTLMRTGKYLQHATIRMFVPKILSFKDLNENLDAVAEALESARILLRLFLQHRTQFEAILVDARAK